VRRYHCIVRDVPTIVLNAPSHRHLLGKYHFLILPRLPSTLSTTSTSTPSSDQIDYHSTDLYSLRTLLAHPHPLILLEELKRTADDCVEMIVDEMRKTEGFEWGVQVGFHAVPSMK
jgi:aprataxin